MFKKNSSVKRIQSSYNGTDLGFQEVLKNSYAKKKAKNIKGYELDNELSNGNNQVYFNPTDKKLLYSVTGTHNLKDWGTDLYLATGHLKETNRYKEAKRTLESAKKNMVLIMLL